MSGANFLIAGSGSYDLTRHALDFRAKISPLGNSKGFVQQLIDVPLSFVSKVFEVRLSGTIDKPEWSFANSPISLLRSPTGDGTAPATPPRRRTRPPVAGPRQRSGRTGIHPFDIGRPELRSYSWPAGRYVDRTAGIWKFDSAFPT